MKFIENVILLIGADEEGAAVFYSVVNVLRTDAFGICHCNLLSKASEQPHKSYLSAAQRYNARTTISGASEPHPIVTFWFIGSTYKKSSHSSEGRKATEFS
jgi:hypothetical protein